MLSSRRSILRIRLIPPTLALRMTSTTPPSPSMPYSSSSPTRPLATTTRQSSMRSCTSSDRCGSRSLPSFLKCVPFSLLVAKEAHRLACQVLPAFLSVMRTCPVGLQEYYFQNLGQLISMVKQHVRNHLGPIMVTIRDFWTSTTNPGLQVIIIDVIQSIAVALDAEFKAYLPNLLPLMLQAFDHDLTEPRRQNSLVKVLHAFGIFGSSLEEYLHLIIPAIVRTFEQIDTPLLLRKQAMQTISQLCRKINFADHASRIIHPLARVLSSPNAPVELRTPAMDAMCALLVQMGTDFVLFVPMINKVRLLISMSGMGTDVRASAESCTEPNRSLSVRDARLQAPQGRSSSARLDLRRAVRPFSSPYESTL